jgi:hypothetical protein
MSDKINLWFGAKINGPVKKLSYQARAELVERVKSLALLDEDRYLIDVVTIITKTTEDFHYSKNSKALFFVVDQLSDKTLSMLQTYVKAVYKKNARAFEAGTNSSFHRLFNDISTQLEAENAPRAR